MKLLTFSAVVWQRRSKRHCLQAQPKANEKNGKREKPKYQPKALARGLCECECVCVSTANFLCSTCGPICTVSLVIVHIISGRLKFCLLFCGSFSIFYYFIFSIFKFSTLPNLRCSILPHLFHQGGLLKFENRIKLRWAQGGWWLCETRWDQMMNFHCIYVIFFFSAVGSIFQIRAWGVSSAVK